MTLSTTSGRRLSKFEKNDRKCHLRRFETNFSGTAFCLPHQVAGFLFLESTEANNSQIFSNVVRKVSTSWIDMTSAASDLNDDRMDEIASIAASRWLQNDIKYCPKVPKLVWSDKILILMAIV